MSYTVLVAFLIVLAHYFRMNPKKDTSKTGAIS